LERKKFSLVDKEGIVLYNTDFSDLPNIAGLKDRNKGEKVSGSDLLALKLIYDSFYYYKIKNGIIENDSLVIEVPDKIRVIFPLVGDEEVLMGSFGIIYNEYLKGENSKLYGAGRNIDTIDLRYKNPVIK
jgi:hypothetical protein